MTENFTRVAKPSKGYSYQQTMIRIKDPKPTLEFY